ncbi:MAG: ABC transporter permease [Thermoproteales archaeon]|nr:ABC transporter permease [Thermoproteales archaeon]
MGLTTYVVRRLLLLIPTMIGVTLLIFALVQFFSPIERASLYIRDPRQARSLESIIEKYHLNDPPHIQYFYWLNEVLHGNLGWSKSVNMPVVQAIFEFLPATLELTIYAIPIILVVGVWLGKMAAVHKDTAVDHIIRAFAIIGWSLPTFWSAIILLAVFYGHLKLFPPERLSTEASLFVNSPNFIRYTRINTIDALLNGQPWIFFDALRHLVLPVLNLTIVIVAILMRVVRSSMLEALGKTYVLAARAKGLPEKEVINKHAMRNAMIPAVTLAGALVAGMLTGLVITETVFNIPGIGRWAVNAAIQLDIPAVLGFALFASLVYVITNLIVDILYAYIDPRIRLG